MLSQLPMATSCQTEEDIAAIAARFEEDFEMSIRRRSAELGIHRKSIEFI